MICCNVDPSNLRKRTGVLMIRLYDGSRLVYSIFCVTTLLDTLKAAVVI